MPSQDEPLTGGCACGAVRFEVTTTFRTAGHCHCHRCQKRSGALFATNAFLDPAGFTITQGAESVTTWEPPEGLPKAFCAVCGGHVYGGDPDGKVVGVRLGAVEGDPGIRPEWHAWLESAPEWAPVEDDDLVRHQQGRPR